MENKISIQSKDISEESIPQADFDSKTGHFKELYAEMRMMTAIALKIVRAINNFEADQDELIAFAEQVILGSQNPYSEMFFKSPDELFRLIIINWSPVNGRVMGDYDSFLNGVVSQLESDDNQVIPSVDLLCEIITGSGLKYTQPDFLSLGGANTMGKTIRKNQTNSIKANGKTVNEQKKLEQAAKLQAAKEKEAAIAEAKRKAEEAKAKAKEEAAIKAAEEKAKAEAEAKRIEAEKKAAKEAEAQRAKELAEAQTPKVTLVDKEGSDKLELDSSGDELKEAISSADKELKEAQEEAMKSLNETDVLLEQTVNKKSSIVKKVSIAAVTALVVIGGTLIISKLLSGSNEDESYDFK